MTGNARKLAETPNSPDIEAGDLTGLMDPLSDILNIVHVRGETARILDSRSTDIISSPAGTPCLVIAQQFSAKIRVSDEPAVTIGPNQLALLLHGHPYEIIFDGETTSSEIGQTAKSDAEQIQGEIEIPKEQACFWGRFSFDTEAAQKMLRSLPSLIVIRNLDSAPIEWLDIACNIILAEMKNGQPGAGVMVSRLLDLLLVQVLRRWAQTEEDIPNWLASAKDERIARAVSAIYNEPAKQWTAKELAHVAGMSRTSFVDLFSAVMRQTPGAYLRNWRLDRAAEQLIETSASIDQIASIVGYQSQEAFSRAFVKRFDLPPSKWRTANQR